MKIILLVFGLLLSACQPKVPLIYSIHPQIGAMGEPISIKGVFFGKDREESYITVAGVQPTGTSYLKWQDNEIVLRMPEFGEAGMIYVYVNGRKSNGVLFANQATLPSQVQSSETGPEPRIISLTPQSGAVGALITINGTGFGNSRGNGGVFFSWNAQTSASAPAETRVREFIEVSETEFGYELWTNREIRIRAPDGAADGNMEVRTARGISPPVVFALSGRPGIKTFRDKRNYTFNLSINVKVDEATAPNTMYLWIPRPDASAAQRNIELLSGSMEPFIDRYRGISLYKIDNLTAGSDVQILLSWKVEVYSVETVIWPQSVRHDPNSSIREAYTRSSSQLPSGDSRIISQVQAIIGREPNPYTMAQKVYEWMTGERFIWEGQSGGDIFYALETKRIDSYLAALLYCTLLRSAGIPCQPVAGVLVNRNRQTMNHYWAEFWLDGFGWIPVDPAMGAAAKRNVSERAIADGVFSMYLEQENSYFGNVDSQRIAFSRGFTNLSPMDSRGRIVAHNRSWSLYNIREEVIGGIEAYSSLWGDITITGIYAQ